MLWDVRIIREGLVLWLSDFRAISHVLSHSAERATLSEVYVGAGGGKIEAHFALFFMGDEELYGIAGA
jgi:hypothetical protein